MQSAVISRPSTSTEIQQYLHGYKKSVIYIPTIAKAINRSEQMVGHALKRLEQEGIVYNLGKDGVYTKFKDIYSGQVDRYEY